VTQTGLSEDCSVTKLDILFKRPEPDAWISANEVSCLLSLGPCEESSRVILQSPRGDFLSVIVDVNGQISVRRVP
ncbi:MAG: hypothetical protein RIQ56_541, partial [Candidatus Parcubacteria bacterium]